MDELEIFELAIAVLGLEGDDYDDEAIEDAIYQRFDIDLETFGCIAKSLLPFAMVGQSPLTGTIYKGFARDDCWIAKTEVKS